jgi:flavin-binding protein dodecin
MSSIVKVVEVIGESPKSFDDAVRNAVRESAKTIKNIKSVWVDNMSGVVEGGEIATFRANVKVSFKIEGHD